ncbi:sigma-54-dependent Fis family transcriptional regulator [Leptothrix discophora]|uniref:Sigma-54-dependent Fis family transcriptional regulator n=1 Tax=Leptothrix discophora TaxID=89 RepID=A0ABT9FZJ6_LEPDI|nr:sigma-54-dependent Fis family transcriptional regulator [Leptothrix discophora]MDP4299645.1 sigma-54-dependent Fis family transcriptional regulator [Leptothrix discophora]
MSTSYLPPIGSARARLQAEEPRRPIATALQLPEEHVERIDQSHERCQALGLSRIERPDFSPLGRTDLSVARERNHRLYTHAAPVMEMLHDQIVESQSMVVLTDATGVILHSIGVDDFLSRANKVALAPGANWSEQYKGTNAVGTALIEERPVLVHADEHYLHANHFLTCSAAPILDPRGNILGVLDVSGDHRGYHQHTMGLVKMSARMIENHWLTDDYRNVMRLHFHSRVEFIGTLMEGIVAVSQDGKLVGANRGALEQLGLSGAALRMHTLSTLFGTTVAALVDRFRSPLATPLPLETNNGRQFHVYARFNWPVWQSFDTMMREQTGEAATGPTASTGPAGPIDLAAAAAAAAGLPAGSVAGASSSAAGAAAGSGPREGLPRLATGDAQVGALLDKIRRVINRDIPILVLGETGTGKELLARAIHQDSDRAKQPFVAVNCASIPDTLIEAELFGYEEGAFTGARRKGAVGKIVQANGGTLFLDEIGDMPIALQAHLLRVLQERQVTPLGSAKSVAVDVMLVCATHRNLREMIEQKTFREDLYYRLNGLAVRLPPLRERSDLMPLVERILERECGRSAPTLSAEVMRLFQAYAWPGNVRQLFNVLRTACVMAAGERVITRDHLSDDFIEDARLALERRQAALMVHTNLAHANLAHADPADASAAQADVGQAGAFGRVPATTNGPSMGELASTASMQPAGQPSLPPGVARGMPVEPTPRSLEDIELMSIRTAVEAAGGNISVAAKQLGISRNTIYRKLRWNKSA